MRRFQYLPWISLFQIAGLTVVFSTLLDLMLLTGLQSLQVNPGILFSPLTLTLLSLVVSFGVGAMSVYLMERLFRIAINAAILWCLILCLALLFIVKSWLPIPTILVGSDQMSFIGLLIGVFWKGARYWRY